MLNMTLVSDAHRKQSRILPSGSNVFWAWTTEPQSTLISRAPS